MNKSISIFILFIFFQNINAQEINDELYMNAYIVVSDTSKNYNKLRKKMLKLSEKLNSEIDTMGRGFNRTKNLICLPENDEDDIYAGDYFPRRFPSETLSLEYLIYYINGSKPTEGTIALVAMVTDDKKKAENKLSKVKNYSKGAFIVNTEIYMGCMH